MKNKTKKEAVQNPKIAKGKENYVKGVCKKEKLSKSDNTSTFSNNTNLTNSFEDCCTDNRHRDCSQHHKLLDQFINEGTEVEIVLVDGKVIISHIINYDFYSIIVKEFNSKKNIIFKSNIISISNNSKGFMKLNDISNDFKNLYSFFPQIDKD